MADNTEHHLTYEGPPQWVGALAQMLHEAGASKVDYQPPVETRSLQDSGAQVVVGLTVIGIDSAVRAGARAFRQRFPGAKVTGIEEPAPDTADRLADLTALHEVGTITAEELAEQRGRILGEI